MLKSQCYICLSCTYNVSTNIIFSHLSKAQASRLTCINRCKDLSLNPINNNLIVLNWIGNARPCMLSDWLKKSKKKKTHTKKSKQKTSISTNHISEYYYSVWCVLTVLSRIGVVEARSVTIFKTQGIKFGLQSLNFWAQI